MACVAKQELTRAGKANSDLWAKWDEQISSHLDMNPSWSAVAQDKSKLRKLITDSGLELPYGPLPVDAVDTNEEDPNKQVRVFYGTLFNHSHRLMASHRRAQTPQSAAGDSRPSVSSVSVANRWVRLRGWQQASAAVALSNVSRED